MSNARVKELLQNNIFNEKQKAGYSFNPYGDTDTVEAWINKWKDEKFPVDENGERKRFHNSAFLYDVYLQEEWCNIGDVYERYWTVWTPMIRDVCEILGKECKNNTELTKALNRCWKRFGIKEASDIAFDDLNARKTWNQARQKLKEAGIQMVIVFHEFEKVQKVFPKNDPECKMFYLDLFQMTPKSNDSCIDKIVLVSKKACSEYAPILPISSLAAAYEPMCVTTEEGA